MSTHGGVDGVRGAASAEPDRTRLGGNPMANLKRSTAAADSVREDCLCVSDCEPGCTHHGRWHNHVDEVCPIHPDTVVDPAQ